MDLCSHGNSWLGVHATALIPGALVLEHMCEVRAGLLANALFLAFISALRPVKHRVKSSVLKWHRLTSSCRPKLGMIYLQS